MLQIKLIEKRKRPMQPNSSKPKLVGLTSDVVKPLTILQRPEVLSMKIELKFQRATAESMFLALVFEDDETEAIITEVLRPAKKDEPPVVRHSGSGVSFVVDHYEIGGVQI